MLIQITVGQNIQDVKIHNLARKKNVHEFNEKSNKDMLTFGSMTKALF